MHSKITSKFAEMVNFAMVDLGMINHCKTLDGDTCDGDTWVQTGSLPSASLSFQSFRKAP